MLNQPLVDVFLLLLSIGSLGQDNSTGIVTGVILDTALLRNTTNGLRIKTWQVIIKPHGEVQASKALI